MNSLNKTFLPSSKYETRKWFIIDCEGQKLGRLATLIATLLKGKIKPHYYPATDIGDYVILVNAESIVVNKNSTHYIVNNPGRVGSALKVRKAIDSLPQVTIERAIKGMLSTTETKRLMRRLHIYTDNNHPHDAQNPIKLDLNNLSFNNKANI